MGKSNSEYLKNYCVNNHYTSNIRQKVEDNSIVYTEPEKEFVDGHPLGNGDLGIMVTGSPSSFKFYISKSDIWDNRSLEKPHENYNNLLKIVEEKNREKIQEINKSQVAKATKVNYPSPQTCGLLEIKFKKELHNKFLHHLNIYNGTDKISWNTKSGNYNIISYVNQNQSISEYNIEYFDRDGNDIEISLYRMPSELYKKEKSFRLEHYLGFEFSFPDGLNYINLVYIDAEEFKVSENLKVETTSNEIRIIQTIVSSYEAIDLKTIAIKKIEDYKNRDKRELKLKSDKFWHNFWNRSYIDLYSKEVEKIWYIGLYLIGSSSRKESPGMAGLQGIWIENSTPAWNGMYVTNLNIEMNYWPVYASNHLDIAEPFYRKYKELIPIFKKHTKDYYNAEGIKIPVFHGLKGDENIGYIGHAFWQGSSAWIASHFWNNYLYSGDKEFLKNTAFPFMEESVKFYNSVLRKKDNKYIVYLSWTPEEMESDQIKAIDNNPVIDLSLIKNLYNSFIEAVDIIGIEPSVNIDIVKRISKNLSAYPQKKGHITDSENCDFDYCHRHSSVLTPIYPLKEFNSCNNSKEDYNLALNTFYKYIKRGNSSRRKYFSGTYTWLSCAAAALGLKDFSNIYLSDYLDSFINRKNYLNLAFDYKKSGRGLNIDDTQEFSSGTEYKFADRVFQLESNTCAAEAVNLMLLQSFKNGISVFPAYPWREGVFEGLRAEGGFLVSSKLKDWKIESIYIKSLYGNICTLYLDICIKGVKVTNITDRKNVKTSEVKRNDIGNKIYFTYNTKKNTEYSIALSYE